MIYNNRNIYEEAPQTADCYRRAYADGIAEFIHTMNQKGKAIRQNFMPPEELVRYPEKYRRLYHEMLGLNRIDGTDCPPAKQEYVSSDDVCHIYRLTVYITRKIPFYAMLLLPKKAAKNAKVPLVITQHGGGGTPELCLDMYGASSTEAPPFWLPSFCSGPAPKVTPREDTILLMTEEKLTTT